MNQTTLFGIVVVPAVVGLTQVAKGVGVPSQFAPLVAIALGVLAGIAQLEATSLPWIGSVVAGVGLGLSAVGLYASGVTLKATLPQRSTTPLANNTANMPEIMPRGGELPGSPTATPAVSASAPPTPDTQPQQLVTNAAGATQPPKTGPS